jgi:RNA polymerase II subunit A small phosphatase-like protein
MSNELAQPTEQDLSRSPLSGSKKSKPPALDISNCTFQLPSRVIHGLLSGGDAQTTLGDIIRDRVLTFKAATDAPQPPSSSTQATSTAQNTIGTEESERTEVSATQNEKDYLTVVDEAAPKKHRGLLHVPSRSSSHKVQPSPTSTGLSGVTASEPQESTGLRSKWSEGSILGRRRNGSATSSRMPITHPGAPSGATKTAGNTIPDISAPRQPKKSFFQILCCGVPDSAADPNNPEVPANRVSKPPVGRPTTASRPDNIVAGQQNDGVPKAQTEKDALNQIEPSHDRHDASNVDASRALQSRGPANGDLGRSVSLRDQPLPALPQDSGPSSSQVNPTAVVQVPVRISPTRMPTGSDPSANRENVEDDARVENTDPLPNEKDVSTGAVARREEVAKPLLPPPPPVPQAASSDEAVPEASEVKQQWLLPPIAPRFKGKKCLVLDLDETLVHSSFKVRIVYFLIPISLLITDVDFASSRLHNPS